MRLDPRIIEGKKPLTCFDTEEAKQFINHTGYVTDDATRLVDVDQITPRLLTDVRDDSGVCFKTNEGNYWRYFLPKEWVKSTDEEQEFAWDSLKLAGHLHFILHSGCYIGRNSVSDDDLKTITEIMAKHSHEEEKFLRDVLERVLTFSEGRW